MHELRTFPLRYNAMIGASAFFAWRATILDFFVSGGSPGPDTRIHAFVQRIMHSDPID